MTADCLICLQSLTNDIVSISGCIHTFHKDCLDCWKNIQNSCPICRKRFQYIADQYQKYKVQHKNQQQDDFLTEQLLNTLQQQQCKICQRTDDHQNSLLCDGCDDCYHTYCIGLDNVPLGDWYCQTCYRVRSNLTSNSSHSGQMNQHESKRNTMKKYTKHQDVLIGNIEKEIDWIPTLNHQMTPLMNRKRTRNEDNKQIKPPSKRQRLSTKNNI
eukprot:36066_1